MGFEKMFKKPGDDEWEDFPASEEKRIEEDASIPKEHTRPPEMGDMLEDLQREHTEGVMHNKKVNDLLHEMKKKKEKN